jgi:hypothetical protein
MQSGFNEEGYMTRRYIDRIQHRFTIGCLMTVCLLTASVPSNLAKKGSFKTQEGSAYIPAGTTLNVRMIDELDTGKAKPGDSFRASLDAPVVVEGRTVASKNALVHGRVTDVVSSGRLKRPASLTLTLTRITLSNGRMAAIETSPYTLDGKSHNVRNAALIGGGAAAGAVLGGVAAGKKGAVIGSAVGAGAGVATAYITGKQELVVPSETGFQFATTGSTAVASSRREASAWGHTAFPSDKKDRDGGWVFGDRDRRVIRDYFRNRYSNLPPGLAKRGGNLPPGLEKHIQRNGQLPPGLQKRVEPFPQDLVSQLPRIPERIRRVILGRRALMLDGNTILDELTLD